MNLSNIGETYYSGGPGTSNTIDLNAFQAHDSISAIDAFGQGDFIGGNDDLDSFFTPGLVGPTKNTLLFEDPSMPQGQWDNRNAGQVFDFQQGFPFSEQGLLMQQYSGSSCMMDTTYTEPECATAAKIQPATNIIEGQLHDLEGIEKPKRGRPRKRKRKGPISEEERLRKREAFLERNRRAASRCRKRKEESIETIQAKASNLGQQRRLLSAELLHFKAEYAEWLNLATEHAKLCANNHDLNEYFKAAENRLAERVEFVPIGGTQEWDCDFSITIDHKNSSASNSGDLLASRLEYFDIAQYENDTQRATQDKEASSDTKTRLLHSSTEIDRKSSISSVDTTTDISSNTDSGYASAPRTTHHDRGGST